MKEELIKLLNNSYAPYSNFHVSAIVVMKDGTKFSGVNVENSSYGGSICAERNAMNSAISHGYKPMDFDKLYVMTSGDKVSMPCFICRQTIIEFFSSSSLITCYDKNGNTLEYKVSELCPYPFSKDDLD